VASKKEAYWKPVFQEFSKAEALLCRDDGGPPKASAEEC
jgi:hypothetical protein